MLLDRPMMYPRDVAMSLMAYTFPYTEECRISIRWASSGINALSTIDLAKPAKAVGTMRPLKLSAAGSCEINFLSTKVNDKYNEAITNVTGLMLQKLIQKWHNLSPSLMSYTYLTDTHRQRYIILKSSDKSSFNKPVSPVSPTQQIYSIIFLISV